MDPAERTPFAAWAAIYALAGFVALSLEIVWFRLLGVILKSTAFVFGTLITQYLFGLGAGALLGTGRDDSLCGAITTHPSRNAIAE